MTPEGSEQRRQPTEEELRAALEQQLKDVRVEQVVLDAAVSILNVAALRAGVVPGRAAERDLDQVRVGIDAVRSLLPVVERAAGAQATPLRDALSQLQLAYVRATGGPSAGEGAPAGQGAPGGADAPPAAAQAPPQPRPGEPGPAQRSGRLWVPGQ